MSSPQKPYWLPDTQGFLAIAIIVIVGSLSFALLFSKASLDTQVAGAFLTVLGVLAGCLKDVFSFFFGSSKGNDKKDDALISGSISPTSTPPIVPPAQAISTAPAADAIKALSIVAIMVLGALMLFPQPSFAQVKLKTPQQIVNDIKSATGQPTPSSSSTTSTPGACDIKTFANLTVANVVTNIQNCIGSVVAGGAAPFVTDVTAALASATAAKDGTAMACLGPALAIATAAQGTPAVDAVPAVPGTPAVEAVSAVPAVLAVIKDGVVVTPEVPAVPAVAAVPAVPAVAAVSAKPATYPGPILIFQKYREFVTAGGPSNCKTAVQSTINGTVAAAGL